MSNEVLEEICDICNIYDVNPKECLKTYNKYINKDYVNKDWVKAIELTERYHKIHNGVRPQLSKWVVQQYIHYDFRRS